VTVTVAGIVSVTSVEVLDHYKLRVTFSDGLVRERRLEPPSRWRPDL
jgi:hypothetical protein